MTDPHPTNQAVPVRARPPVAFVDESYSFTPNDPTRDSLYVLAAVVIDGDELTSARQAARDLIAPDVGYHSTDLFHDGRVEKVHTMLGHVRDETQASIVAIQAPFDGHADLARQQCLRQLVVELSDRKVGHVVLDSRVQPRASDVEMLNKDDLRTIRALRADGEVHRHLAASHATDDVEPLLWLPDGVAWSVRRALAVDDNEHYELIAAMTTLLVLGENNP